MVSHLINSVTISSFAFLILTWLIFIFAVSKLGLPKKTKIIYSTFISVILLSWYLMVLFIGRMGLFAKNPLVAPFLLIGFIVLFGILQKVYKSKKVQEISDNIPIPWIIGIQAYRIVGFGFFIFYLQGQLPAQFAFPAGIGDMIVGIAAPYIALLFILKKPYAKKAGILWNILGISDLIVAIGVGILSFPRPIQVIQSEPSTELISLFPLVLIPLFAVPLAFLLHLFSLRLLRKMR